MMLAITKNSMAFMQEIYFAGYNIRYIDEAKQGKRGFKIDIITDNDGNHFTYKNKKDLYKRGLEIIQMYNTPELNAIRITIGRVVLCLVSAWK